MRVAGVVVLYNPDKSINKNIKSYIDDIEKLYVVDNSDEDHSKKFKADKIEYIFNGKNLGIATALNIAAEKAIEEKYEWLLTMDQDSSFEKKGVSDMKEFLINLKENNYISKVVAAKFEEIGLISPLHVTKNNIFDISNEGIDNPMNVMTSGNLINLNAYKKISGYKDWFFIDGVDFEYCLNLRKNNFKLLRLNFIKLDHSLGDCVFKTFLGKKMFSLNHSPIRRYYIVRNRHYLNDLYKDAGFSNYCLAEIKRTKRELIKIWICEKQKIKKTIYMYIGYRDYKKGIKGIKK